jgi:hypothetical protein
MNGSYAGVVTSLVVSGSNVYAGGWCSNSSGVAAAGYWLNGSWVTLSNPYVGSYYAQVNSLVIASQ